MTDITPASRDQQTAAPNALRLERKNVRRAITAAALGNAVEWYDAAIYLYIASTIGKVFFAGVDGTVQLLLSFGLFAIAYLVRPVGGFVFGLLGDRVGRQKVLSLTIILMGLATVGIGLIPSPEHIGIWAPILLVLFRLVQGFSAGGEYGSATTFIAEYVPDRRRGFYGAWLECGTLAGFALGAGVVTLVLIVVENPTDWAWRIPFLIAGPLTLVGTYLRSRLEDTPAFKDLENSQVATSTNDTQQESASAGYRSQWRAMVACAGLVLVFNVGYYLVLTYLPVYLEAEAGISESGSLGLTFAIMIGMIIVNPWVGALSDKWGRRRLLMAGCIGFLVLSVPAFLLMQGPGAGAVIGVVALCTVFVCFTAVIPSTLPALFPTKVRNGAMGISYNVTVSLFGGTTPLIVTALIAATGNKLMPAFWMMLAAAIGLIAVICIRESAQRPLPGSRQMIDE